MIYSIPYLKKYQTYLLQQQKNTSNFLIGEALARYAYMAILRTLLALNITIIFTPYIKEVFRKNNHM